MPRRSARNAKKSSSAAQPNTRRGTDALFRPSNPDIPVVEVVGWVHLLTGCSKYGFGNIQEPKHTTWTMTFQHWRWQEEGASIESGRPLHIFYKELDPPAPRSRDGPDEEGDNRRTAPWYDAIREYHDNDDIESLFIKLKVYKEERDAHEGAYRSDNWKPMPAYRFHSVVDPCYLGDSALVKHVDELDEFKYISDEQYNLELEYDGNDCATSVPVEERGSYEGEMDWLGREITLTLAEMPLIGHPRHKDLVDKVMEEILYKLLDNQESWTDRIFECAEKHMLDLYNKNWADPDNGCPQVTAREFRAKQHVSSLTIYAKDGSITFELDTDDESLFTDHGIRVSGTIQDGFTDARL